MGNTFRAQDIELDDFHVFIVIIVIKEYALYDKIKDWPC